MPVNDNGDDDDDDDDDGDDDDDDNQPVCGVERVAGEERGEKRGNAHHHKRPSSLFIQLYSWLYRDDFNHHHRIIRIIFITSPHI